MNLEAEREPPGEVGGAAPAVEDYRWWQKIRAVLFVWLSFGIGLSLVVLPWTRHWNLAFLPVPAPVWTSFYAKGAATGLGFVNLWIGFVEVFRLRRFAGH